MQYLYITGKVGEGRHFVANELNVLVLQYFRLIEV